MKRSCGIKDPVRFLYKNWGLTYWKYGRGLPEINLHFGGLRSIGITGFHNGRGFEINLLPVFRLQVCFKGKICWTYKPGKFSIRIFNWQFTY